MNPDRIKILLAQFTRILALTALAEILAFLIPVRLPAAVYGLLLMIVALRTGLYKPDQVETVGQGLVGLLPLLFVTPLVGLIEVWPMIRNNLFPILTVIVIPIFLVMIVSGRVTQTLLTRRGPR